MTPEWSEGRLEFDFAGADEVVEKPDALARPLKSVDFIVRFRREIWLIEVKDPEGSPIPHRDGAVKDTISTIQNGGLLREHLLPKLYGTFAYLVEEKREPRGAVRYGVIIGLASLTWGDRTLLTNRLQRTIDRIGPKIRHSRHWPVAEVHTVDSWNAAHSNMRIVRHP